MIDLKFIIVTGMSGAGKSTALKCLEDLGYFCVDNLPPALISKFAEICFRKSSEIDSVAIGVDIRGGKLFDDLFAGLSDIDTEQYDYRIMFLDASDDTLLKRYKETRRAHPLAKIGRIAEGIERERKQLNNVKDRAHYIIDTSHLLTRQLKEKITDIFIDDKDFDSLMITVLTFGFKYGVPDDADLVFDVRFVPNPYYVDGLREKTGNDAEVREYVMGCEASRVFLGKLLDMLTFLIPNYVSEGKNQLVIAVGCTGGRHRSVTIAGELFQSLQKEGRSVIIDHRDIYK
jgi:UPF0042 nucleotide-binding protein